MSSHYPGSQPPYYVPQQQQYGYPQSGQFGQLSRAHSAPIPCTYSHSMQNPNVQPVPGVPAGMPPGAAYPLNQMSAPYPQQIVYQTPYSAPMYSTPSPSPYNTTMPSYGAPPASNSMGGLPAHFYTTPTTYSSGYGVTNPNISAVSYPVNTSNTLPTAGAIVRATPGAPGPQVSSSTTHPMTYPASIPSTNPPSTPAAAPSTDPSQATTKKSGIGKVASAVATKVGEISLLTTNKAKNTFAALSNLWKGTEELEGLKPPPGAFTASIFATFEGQLQLNSWLFEQLYYMFRNVADEKSGKCNLSAFRLIFPAHTSHKVIELIYNLFLEDNNEDGIDFPGFVVTLSWIMKGTGLDKLNMVYNMLTKQGTLLLTMELLYDTCASIAREMAEFGTYGMMRAKEVDKTISLVFSDKTTPLSTITKDEFLSKGEISSDLMHCFGLLRFVQKYTIDRINNSKLSPYEPIMGLTAYKEGFLNKHYPGVVDKWSIHWCVVSRGFFMYWSDLETYAQPHRVLSLRNATVERITVPGKTEHAFQITLGSVYSRKFACKSAEECDQWISAIQAHIQTQHRFGSTFPIRSGIKGEFYVDGKEGFSAILQAIRSAKETIFIADWYFSAELYLLRPIGEPLNNDNRLDYVLKAKAEEGVKVCILLWNETKVVTPLNSEYVQDRMQGLNKNIWVQRHPLMHPIKWSHHQKIVVVDQDIAFVGGLDLCFGRYDGANNFTHFWEQLPTSRILITDENHYITDPNSKIWPGKDYYNPVIAPFEDVENAFVDSFDRTKHPRMAWHDVHMKVEGEAARDVARNFIERWNWAKQDLQRISSPILYPKSKLTPIQGGTLTCQVLRSIGAWHFNNFEGFPNEQSIYNAYLHFIENAEKFIYIENQFFISSLAGEPVFNEVARTIYQRIRKAILNDEIFRVIVVLPVHPDGTYKDDSGIRFLMKWQYHTINRGESSLLTLLSKEFPSVDLSQYITFNALRKSEFLYTIDAAVTEQIYVHSKLLIVDDRVALIGSANINDRSFAGDRDSEIAIVVEDKHMLDSTMAGKPYKVAKFAHELRMKLWCEHLGIPHERRHEIQDPISNFVWNNIWLQTAKSNTEIFRQVFPLAPDDRIDSLKALEEQKMTDTSEARRLLGYVKGHLIEFPLNFLKNTNLDPDDIATSIVDVDIFT